MTSARSQFGEDGRGPITDGLRAQAQPSGDFGIAQAAGDQVEHRALAGRELGKSHGGAGGAAAVK